MKTPACRLLTSVPLGHTVAHMSTSLLTVNEAAARLGMSRRSIYRLIETDELPSVRGLTPGAPVRFRTEDLDAFVTARTTPTRRAS